MRVQNLLGIIGYNSIKKSFKAMWYIVSNDQEQSHVHKFIIAEVLKANEFNWIQIVNVQLPKCS